MANEHLSEEERDLIYAVRRYAAATFKTGNRPLLGGFAGRVLESGFEQAREVAWQDLKAAVEAEQHRRSKLGKS